MYVCKCVHIPVQEDPGIAQGANPSQQARMCSFPSPAHWDVLSQTNPSWAAGVRGNGLIQCLVTVKPDLALTCLSVLEEGASPDGESTSAHGQPWWPVDSTPSLLTLKGLHFLLGT